MKFCPAHIKALVKSETKYGPRYDCPVSGCTVMCWNGKTSLPADQETRDARIEAHDSFDALWKGQKHKRGYYYGKLADYLGLSPQETHIGMFDIETCKRVVGFAKLMRQEA